MCDNKAKIALQGKSVLSIFFTSQNPISNESKQFLLMIKDKLICIDMKFEFWILKNVHKPQSIFLWILTLHSFLFKDAINLTAMDKRSFAPPIETNWERVVNMANTCETFRINPTTTSRLIKCGFTSITLVRIMSFWQVIKCWILNNCYCYVFLTAAKFWNLGHLQGIILGCLNSK